MMFKWEVNVTTLISVLGALFAVGMFYSDLSSRVEGLIKLEPLVQSNTLAAADHTIRIARLEADSREDRRRADQFEERVLNLLSDIQQQLATLTERVSRNAQSPARNP